MTSNALNSTSLRAWSAASAAALLIAVLPVVSWTAEAADSESVPGPVRCTIEGTAGDDVLVGGPGADVLCGRGGDDTLRGGGGKDVLRGEAGDDLLLGADGDDELQGGRGDDVLRAGDGDDDFRGGRGDDTLHGLDAARFRDDLRCGPGRSDRAFADATDEVARSCEQPAPNGSPTDMALTPATVVENSAVGTQVGLLSVTDPDADDTHTLSLVAGTGDTDNSSFTIAGQRLLTAKSFDFESDPSLSVRVRATDSAGASYDEVLTVSVTDAAENTAPVAVDDTFSTTEDTLLSVPASGPGSPAANDQDSDALSVTGVSGATGGTVDLVAGTIRFTPAADRCGLAAAHFDYIVSDGHGGTDVGRVTVDVTCVPDNPTANDDTATRAEDGAASAIAVLANDADPDGDPLTIASVTQPDNGTVAITGGGSGLTYAPDAGYCNTPPGNAPDTFTYTLTPGGATATVAVTVTCVDDAPVAVADTATVDEDDAATPIAVLANDTDLDGGPKSVASVTQPDNGTVVVTDAGLSYTPDANYCNDPGAPGGDTFTYALNGGSTATVAVTVTCVEDAPVALDDTATVTEDSAAGAITVLSNDTDVDGGPKNIQSVTQPDNGTVAITGAGTGLTYAPDTDYCNDPGAALPDTFTYTLNGGSTATVSVTVTCVDDAPVAVDDQATVAEDAAATAIAVRANDTDVDGGPKSIDATTQPADGTVVITGGGTGLTYTPNANYCNDPGAPGVDSFTYTLNGGSTATVSVTVTCVDDNPVAVDDADTVFEDATATAVAVLANDTDVDGGTTSIDSVTQPANGTVAITGGGSGLTYEPDADYCNDPGVAPADTFTYTLNGGSTATVSVTVTCDTPPSAVADTVTVAEDAAASEIDVLTNDTNPDGGPKSVISVTDPTNGTATVTLNGVSYAPDADYCNDPGVAPADTFTYTLNGGSSATVSVTVTCVDDAPVALNDSATADEDDAPGAIDVLANDTDVDGGTKSIASVTQPANGAVVITGLGSGLTYAPDADYCNTGGSNADTFTYTLNGGSTATVSVTVTCADDPPVAVDDTATVTEDDAATGIAVLANDTDDFGPKSVASVVQPSNGTVAITGGGTGLTYEPHPNYCNDPGAAPVDSFTYALNGGSTATVSVTVTCVDDNPVAVDDTTTVAVNASATTVNVLANDTDVDGGTTSINTTTDPANGTVVITGGGTGLTYQPDAAYCNSDPGGTADTFTYTLNGGSTATVSVTVTCDVLPVAVDDSTTVLEDGAASEIDVMANDTNPDGGPKNVISVTQPTNGTAAVTLDGVSYMPDANYCNSATGGTPDTFTYRLNGDSEATVSVTVTCVDDAPTAASDAASVAEDSGATAVLVLTNDTDIDAGPMVIASVTQPANGSVVRAADGSGLTYAPSANYCNTPPGTALDTFTYTLNGGSTGTVTMTVTCVNDAPVADDEALVGAIGNTTLIGDDPTDAAPTVSHISRTITADLIDGDTDVDGPGSLSITAGTFASNLGGSVVLEADGDFTFTPAPGCATSDYFDYTVSDSAATPATDTGRVTLTISECVWYVDNSATGDSGTSAAPFDTLAQAQTASGAGHTTYVFKGDGTSTGYAAGFDLDANERLLGEAANLQVGGVLLSGGVSTERPTITDTATDVVVLAAGNTVRGIQVDPQGGGGITGGAGDASGTIHDVLVTDAGTFGTRPGLELNGTSGTWDISGLTVTNGGSSAATGIRLTNAGTVNFGTAVGPNSVTTSSAKALDFSGTGLGTASTFADVTVTNSSTGGVALVNTTGTISLGNGALGDLSLTGLTGATAAFLLSNAGNVTVPAGGTSNIAINGGPAIDVTGTAGATLAFDDVDSANSAGDGTNNAGDGISISGLGTGTFSANSSSSITNAGGVAFDLDGGSGAVTFDGTITDDLGQLVRVQNATGGTKDFNGTITDGGDGDGGGVSLTSNTGATVRFDGGLTLSTGANPAFAATGGGSVSVTDPNAVGTTPDNTIVTAGGTALNVSNTTIAAEGANFRSISANGGTNGIVLNTTGTSGRLIVSGNGGTCTIADTSGCTGGAIANSIGADSATTTPGGTGIVLNNTLNPSFTRMRIHDHSNYGVRGTNVAGLTMTDSVVNGVNGTSALTAHKDGSLRFEELTGTVSFTNVALSGGHYTNLMVDNTAGALNGTFDNVDSGTIDATGGDDAVQFEGIGTSTMNVDYKNSAITTASGDLFQYIGDGTGGGNLDLTGNTLTNNEPSINTGGGGVALIAGAKGAATMDVLNNTMRDSLTNMLTVIKSADVAAGTNNLVANITGNTIGAAAVANSGSYEGDGMEITTFGDGNATFNVMNNDIRQYNSSGIQFVSGSGVAGTGQMNLKIGGNAIGNPGTNPLITLLQGIRVDSGVNVADTFTTCVDFDANSITGASDTAIKDFRLVASQNTTLRQPGYGGGATDGAAFAAYAAGLIGSGAQGTAVANPPGVFAGGAACS